MQERTFRDGKRSPGVARAILATILGGLTLACPAPEAPSRPNLLLVTLDTTRADHLGCYGYALDTSPHLDALARDAVRFDLAVSTSAITPIAHASIFTGLNPWRHGLRVFYGPPGHYLDDTHPTLATLLRARGYRTAAFVSAYPASERFGLHHGFQTFETEVAESVMRGDPRRRVPKDGFWASRRTALAQRRADATVDQALAWLDDVRGAYLLWVHVFDPHDPSLVPPPDVTERFDARPGGPDAARRVYDPEIFFMDAQLGRLFEALERRGEYDRTVIVVIADHGQGLGDHGWFPHRLLYQEQIRVPFLLRAPGAPRGRVVADLVRNVDVLPTVLDYLAVDPPPGLDGRSLRPLLAGRRSGAAPPAFAEALNTLDAHAPPGLPPHQRDLLFSVVDPPWKLIHHRNEPANDELYDLAADPGELRNRADERPDEVARLRALLEASGAFRVKTAVPDEPPDPESVEKLRSLGYLD